MKPKLLILKHKALLDMVPLYLSTFNFCCFLPGHHLKGDLQPPKSTIPLHASELSLSGRCFQNEHGGVHSSWKKQYWQMSGDDRVPA